MVVRRTTRPPPSAEYRLITLAKRRRVVKASDVSDLGVHTTTLTRLVRSGVLERVAPGRYCLANSDGATENHSLVLVAGSVPAAAVCLLTALRFHNIGTQLPREVWLAVPRGTRVPTLSYPPIRVVNVAPALFGLGIERHRLEGQVIQIAGVSRTIADCFRFRNKVGLDVALEALVEARRSRRLNLDELYQIATALRVERVMRPYLEMLMAGDRSH